MSTPKRIAIIDLGSNTARLVIFSATPGYAFRLEDEVREVVRLRQGMTATGLSDAAMERAFSALRLFARFCHAMQVDTIIPTATSAVRDAANGPRFVERVREELGLTLGILDGEREAYYGALGALNEVSMGDGWVMDIGGGSAQVSRVVDRRFRHGQSAPIGALALTERFVSTDPISKKELAGLEAGIAEELDRLDWSDMGTPGNGDLVGVGGTIRNLAKIEAARQGYPLSTLTGFELTLASVDESIDQFRSLPLAERRRIPGLRTDRADIILAGALVLRAVMARLGVERVRISVNGLREGLFLEQFWDHLAYPVIPDVRRFSVLNMARIYGYQKAHANHVRYLAGRLFEQLAPLHAYASAERELLDAASLLHDLGTLINYNDHHIHSQMLIVNNGLAGFTPRETALIALLSRYHRKGKPTLDPFDQLMRTGKKVDDAEDDGLLLIRLAAILRLAEFMERGRNGAVDDVVVTWGEDYLRLTLVADIFPAVELWQTERYALDLVQSAFGRPVQLDTTAAPAG